MHSRPGMAETFGVREAQIFVVGYDSVPKWTTVDTVDREVVSGVTPLIRIVLPITFLH